MSPTSERLPEIGGNASDEASHTPGRSIEVLE